MFIAKLVPVDNSFVYIITVIILLKVYIILCVLIM